MSSSVPIANGNLAILREIATQDDVSRFVKTEQGRLAKRCNVRMDLFPLVDKPLITPLGFDTDLSPGDFGHPTCTDLHNRSKRYRKQ